MFDKILVPLDGSELAEVALPYAEGLMRRLNSEMVLLCACNPDENSERGYYLAKVANEIEQRTKTFQEKHPEIQTNNTKVESLTLNGNPPDQITDYIEENHIGLTMIATHGRSGMSRWAMGSVAEKVMRGVSMPVYLIRAKGCQAEVRSDCMVSRIFVPLDGSKHGEAVLPFIETLASKLNAEIVLFQTVPKDNKPDDNDWIEVKKMADRNAKIYLRKIESNLLHKGIPVRTIVEFGGNPSKEIVRLAERTRSSVVAMTTHGRSGVDRMVFGSVAEKVLRSGTTPLLLVHSPGSEPPRKSTDGAHCSIRSAPTEMEIQ